VVKRRTFPAPDEKIAQARAPHHAGDDRISAVTAVHTIWLSARAEGIGMGWVSILDPRAVATLPQVPAE